MIGFLRAHHIELTQGFVSGASLGVFILTQREIYEGSLMGTHLKYFKRIFANENLALAAYLTLICAITLMTAFIGVEISGAVRKTGNARVSLAVASLFGVAGGRSLRWAWWKTKSKV